MVTLNIDQTTCIKCGKCVRICPSLIFTQENLKSEVELHRVETCISCGHCVAICPTSSVLHSAFPPEKVHPIDKQILPRPEQVLLLTRARRSNRAFSSKPIPVEMLDQILEAAHAAPTASNMQQVEFTLVTDPKLLHLISKLTIDIFSELAKKLTNPLVKPIVNMIIPDVMRMLPAFHRIIDEFDNGNDLILRKATAVIFIHTPKKSRFGMQDSNLSYQNASLMAESLGVAQFYTGFVCNGVIQDKKKNRLARALGIEGQIHAGIALGMPDFKFTNYIDKKDIKVNRL